MKVKIEHLDQRECESVLMHPNINWSCWLVCADYDAGRFYDDARAATEIVLAKGAVPIVVGGTGMYLRWWVVQILLFINSP